jgi:hypothetical protein
MIAGICIGASCLCLISVIVLFVLNRTGEDRSRKVYELSCQDELRDASEDSDDYLDSSYEGDEKEIGQGFEEEEDGNAVMGSENENENENGNGTVMFESENWLPERVEPRRVSFFDFDADESYR